MITIIYIYKIIAYVLSLIYMINYQTNHHKALIETHHPVLRSPVFHWDEACMYILYSFAVTMTVFNEQPIGYIIIIMVHSLFIRWFFHSYLLSHKRGIKDPWNYTGVNIIDNDTPDSANDKILYNIQELLGIKPIITKIIFYSIYMIISSIYFYNINT